MGWRENHYLWCALDNIFMTRRSKFLDVGFKGRLDNHFSESFVSSVRHHFVWVFGGQRNHVDVLTPPLDPAAPLDRKRPLKSSAELKQSKSSAMN